MLGHRKLDSKDYADIFRRRRLLILLPTVLFPILAVISTYFIEPRYTSQTLVIVDEQKVPDEYVKPILASDLDNRLASMREQMLSRSRIEPIVERYHLYNSSRNTMDDRVDMARKAIVIKPIHSEIPHASGLPGFYVLFTDSDPHVAQLVCGEITSIFLNEDIRTREASSAGTTDFLKDQLSEAKSNLDEQDKKLADFQRQYVGKLPGEEATNVNMLSSLNTQLEASTQALARMEQDRTYQESLLAQQTPTPVQGGPLPESPTTPSYQSQALALELQNDLKQEAELTSHYTADHPDVIAIRRRIADLRHEMEAAPAPAPTARPARSAAPPADSQIVQQLRAQIRASDVGIESKRREQASIENAIHLYQDRIQSSPEVNEQYKVLTRDYETAKKFYEDLLTKMNHSKMANELDRRQEGEQFRMLDAANLPDSPTFPKGWMFFLGGIVLGLAAGVGLAALIEYKDTSVRTERDVWVFTKLPTLAVICLGPHEEAPRESLFRRVLARLRGLGRGTPKDSLEARG